MTAMPRTLSPRRALPAALTLAAGLLLAGCAVPEPWVKPFERERLADPIMNPARDALASRHNAHTREVREGARGGTAVQGGGCGCN
jgi:Domain of unknown function (DUF4266)